MLAVAAGGAGGALLRFWVGQAVYALLGRGFPFGTLVVNVSGSLAMGVLYVMFFERYDVAPDGRFLMVENSEDFRVVVVEGFFEELKRLVPTGRPGS